MCLCPWLRSAGESSIERGDRRAGYFSGSLPILLAIAAWRPRTVVAARLADYLQLTRPRIAVLALLTVTLGFGLGSAGAFDFTLLLHALFGIGLVAFSSTALNQLFERHSDARMPRTADRPLPSGRLSPLEAAAFGLGTGFVGIGWLWLWVNLLTAALALLTLAMYALVYTPLKRRTTLCTALGAVPGAMPPVLGWAASGTPLDVRAFCLFGIMFLWQFPHFLAIAWLYRDEYHAAGLRMLPLAGRFSRLPGVLSVAYASALIPVSLLPTEWLPAGRSYLVMALVLGIGYWLVAVRFAVRNNESRARQLLYASLIYLPVLLLVLTWDHIR
jgi:protoheme IX farnesyltransferase